METKSIKYVDEGTWKNNEKFRNEIVNAESLLSEKAAEEMTNITKNFRKERGFRD